MTDRWFLAFQIISPYENLVLIALLVFTALSLFKTRSGVQIASWPDAENEERHQCVRWCKCCHLYIVHKVFPSCQMQYLAMWAYFS